MTAGEIEALLPEVLKRDVLDGDGATKAKRLVSRAAQKALRKVQKKPVPAESAA